MTLVDAKLAAPSLRHDVVERPRVTRALEQGADARVTLFEAPAGYGKSTAIRSWCANQDAGVMWVTLDSGDDDPVRMWTYIATAVERIRPGVAHSVLQRLEIQGLNIEQAVDELLTLLGRSRSPAILILDDLHTVTNHDSLASIDRALSHLPDNLRVIIGTRVDPPLAIPRMRAAQQLTELRASDLAFAVPEAHCLLVDHFGLNLSLDQTAALVERTQGWPAMLVLTGIWLRGVDDPESAVARFSGAQQFVADYLSTEVLAALDNERHRFLQQLAVLGQFTPALCDAVLERTDSEKLIEDLRHSGLFVSRLDQGNWYRIHPLFAEYAKLELEATEPGGATVVHHNAARWLADRWPVDAMGHASAADEPAYVAELLAEHHLSLIRSGSGRTLLRWAGTLPDDVLIAHPEVAVASAIATLLLSASTVDRNRYLGLVDRAIDNDLAPADGYVASAALIARTLALEGGVTDAVETGRRAVGLTQAIFDDLSDGAEAATGRALYFAGAVDEARDMALRALQNPDATRRPPTLIHAHATLALVAVEQSRLSSARGHADTAKDLVGRIGTSRSWLGANVVAARGALLLAEGQHAEACRQLATAEHFFRDDVANVHHTWILLLLARAYAGRGRLDEASQTAQVGRDALAELPDAGILPGLADAADLDIVRAGKRARAGAMLSAPSDAEMAVLRLIAEDLSLREIGARLYVSENTIRTHRRALYRKLGAHSREEVIARAIALQLLGEQGSPGEH
ncbi:MAG: LuxR C-terminal-related transcriptional regulator [Actinomycetes bacterium]